MTEGKEIKKDPIQPNTNTDALVAMTKELEDTKKELIKERKKSDKIKQDSLLAQLKEGGYKVDHFKDLSVPALEATVKALNTSKKKIKIPEGKEKVKEDPTEPMIWNPKTKQMEPFYS